MPKYNNPKITAGRNSALLYLVLTSTWPVLKLLGLASGSWWRVTCLLWGPWAMLLVVFALGLLLRAFVRQPTEPAK